MRPDGAARQLQPLLDVTPSWRLALPVRADPREAHVLHVPELFVGPLGARSRLLEEPEPSRLFGEVPHRRRALQGDDLAPLVAVERVAAGEHRLARELGVGDLVIVEAAFHAEQVAGEDARTAEPPFVSAEDHVRAGDAAHDRGTGAVADVAADRERLWRDDSPES